MSKPNAKNGNGAATNPSMRWIRVAATRDVKGPLCVEVEGKKLALFKVLEKYYAIDNTCPHAGGPLCEGEMENGVITCPWHGSQFKVVTGEVIHGPASTPVAVYPTEVRGDEVFVGFPDAAAGGSAAPKPVTFKFKPAFDAAHPFAHEPFVTELTEGLGFPFKLYGKLPLIPIAQSADEVDLYLGEVHLTEVDLKQISSLMLTMNSSHGTDITFCVFQTSQFPGALILNVRGPKAPMSLESDIRY